MFTQGIFGGTPAFNPKTQPINPRHIGGFNTGFQNLQNHTTVQFGMSQPAPQPTPVMNRFIDLDKYAVYEQTHGGWVFANAIKRQILGDAMNRAATGAAPPLRILEIGCSSGTSTIPMVLDIANRQLLGNGPMLERYDALDIDPEGIEKLESQLEEWRQRTALQLCTAVLSRKLSLEKALQNVAYPEGSQPQKMTPDELVRFFLTHVKTPLSKVFPTVADAMRHQVSDSKQYTHGVSQFALSHFDDAGKEYLLEQLQKTVDLRNGCALITDEFLPEHGPGIPDEPAAYWHHHGAVILDALVKGNYELAELELEAFYSGLHQIGDFKISCREFEKKLKRHGLRFRKFKAFPMGMDIIPPRPAALEAKPVGAKTKEAKADEGRNPLEQRVFQLWDQYSPEIFRRCLTSSPASGKLPIGPRQALHRLIAEFQKTPVLSQLRRNAGPLDVNFDADCLEVLEEAAHDQPLSKQWGVYTYQIWQDTAGNP